MTHPSPVPVNYVDGINVIHAADFNAYGTAINQLGTLTNPLPVTAGGTGATTLSAGLVVASGASTFTTTPFLASAAVDAEQFCTLTSAYGFTASVTPNTFHQLFNSSANGAVTLPIGAYFFECFFTLSGMSASTATFGWSLVPGTATIAFQLWKSEASTTALVTPVASVVTVNTAANTAIVATSTSTLGWAKIGGKCRISVAGTVIPSICSSLASQTPTVGVDSYFRIWNVGLNTVQTSGTWT